MHREALFRLAMRKDPASGSPQESEMLPGEIGRQVELSQDGNWAKMVVYSKLLSPRSGWIILNASVGNTTEEVQAPPRPEFSLWAFLKECIDAEEWINKHDPTARFFVIADYLIALAHFETKIKNAKAKTTLHDGSGPFQIPSDRWGEFIADPAGAAYTDLDREDPFAQIHGAAYLAMASMNAVSDGIAAHDLASGSDETSGETGPYVPSYSDVILAWMFGNDAAVAIRVAKLRKASGQSARSILEASFAANDLDELIKHRRNVLVDEETGDVETVEGLLINIETELDQEFKKALKLITEYIPEHLPAASHGAPWFHIAETELADWEATLKDEHTAEGKQRVLKYFQQISFNTSTVQPWCGAFAGYCMHQSGPPYDAFVVKGPARAANWKSWGNVRFPNAAENIPKGAVIILAPEAGSSRSGHVGFFNRFLGSDKKFVEILGGNQSDTVTRTKFARSKIAAVRWHDSIEQKNEADAAAAITNLSGGKYETLLRFIGDLESNNNYNAFYGAAGNTNNPDFGSMNVDQVLQWQRNFVRSGSPSSAVGCFQFIRKTLNGLKKQGYVSGGDLMNKASQDALAIALMQQRRLGKYISGAISSEDFALQLAKEWASLPVPRDVRRGSRTVRRGQSYYAGDGLNKALVSVEAFIAAVESLKS